MRFSIDKGVFCRDGRNFYPYAGEMHYFRIPPEKWGVHLDKALEAGLNTVSTYLPWCIHEAVENRFEFSSFSDFSGLVKVKGLDLIARVGPLSNAELVFEGLPAWLTEKYPQVYLKGRELGNLPHDTLVAYNHPDFLRLVSKWYDNILPVIRGQLLSEGGPVSMVQLCNEIGMVHWLNRAADYNGYSEKLYREFLRKKYGSIESLNRAYSASFTSFDEISQPSEISVGDTDSLLPYTDWIYYYCFYYAEYYGFLYKKALEHGIDVPVIANAPQFYDYDVRGRGVFSPMTTLMFCDFAEKVPGVVIGGAYQMRRLDYENFHDIILTSRMMDMISRSGNPAICSELQFGIMRDRPRIYPSDVELNLKTSAGSGLGALNGYMFSGGENFGGTGAMGNYHEWQAPVSSAGGERAHYAPVREFGKLIKCAGGILAGTKPADDMVFGFYPPYYATELLSGPLVDKLETERTVLFYDGLARAAILAGYSFSFKDITEAYLEELSGVPEIFCLSFEMMDEGTQRKLAEYVISGGKLLMYPRIPVRNLKNEPCSIFSDMTGIRVKALSDEKFVYMKGIEAMIRPPVQVFEVSGSAQSAAAETSGGETCAVKARAGKGQVFASGFGFTHDYDYHIRLADIMFSEAGFSRQIKRDPESEIITLLRTSEDGGFIFVFNYHEMPGSLWAEFPLPGKDERLRIPSSGRLEVPGRRAYMLPVNIDIAPGIKILYATAELSEFSFSSGKLQAVFRGFGRTEAVFITAGSPSSVKIDGIPSGFSFESGRLILQFNLKKDVSEVLIEF